MLTLSVIEEDKCWLKREKALGPKPRSSVSGWNNLGSTLNASWTYSSKTHIRVKIPRLIVLLGVSRSSSLALCINYYILWALVCRFKLYFKINWKTQRLWLLISFAYLIYSCDLILYLLRRWCTWLDSLATNSYCLPLYISSRSHDRIFNLQIL